MTDLNSNQYYSQPVFVRCDANFMWDSKGYPYINDLNMVDSKKFIEESKKPRPKIPVFKEKTISCVNNKIKRISLSQLPAYTEKERIEFANEERSRWGNDIDEIVRLRKIKRN